jgi:transposase
MASDRRRLVIRDLFWLTDAQFARLEPFLPTDTRGKPRVDDRRVISGIVHVLKSGGRWIDAPDACGPCKTLYNQFVRWSAKGVWVDIFHALAFAGGPPAQVLGSVVKAHCCASGGTIRRIGRSRGGRTTKIHALTDAECRPIAFMLTGGHVAHCTAAALLLRQMPASSILHTKDTTAMRSVVMSRIKA